MLVLVTQASQHEVDRTSSDAQVAKKGLLAKALFVAYFMNLLSSISWRFLVQMIATSQAVLSRRDSKIKKLGLS
jgi:hypothetical protein